MNEPRWRTISEWPPRHPFEVEPQPLNPIGILTLTVSVAVFAALAIAAAVVVLADIGPADRRIAPPAATTTTAAYQPPPTPFTTPTALFVDPDPRQG